MKKIYSVIAVLLLTTSVFAQAPQKMSYQAVIRNISNALVTSAPVGMKISILQSKTTGTVVYAETQTTTTNANGLVSLEIGSGTPVTGTFAGINWATGTYFIKTETDPTGGTSYTITGVSQLLSVPYALNAKTAESITGTISEIDPIYTGSQAANITAADITKLNSLSGTNTGDQDLSGLATTTSVTTALNLKVDKVAGKGLSTNDYTTAEKTKLTGIATGAQVNVKPDWNAASGNVAEILNKPTTLTIGQSYQGGIIFWLDASGQHGLIAATTDQSTGAQWYNGSYTTTNAVRDGIGAGKFNTERIIANQGIGSYAAQLCANYQGGNFGDWYLPSKYELNLLYQQRAAVGGFVGVYYWSSTEDGNVNAGTQFFTNGGQYSIDKYYTDRVRAVRAF